jgi:hypothetical protein
MPEGIRCFCRTFEYPPALHGAFGYREHKFRIQKVDSRSICFRGIAGRSNNRDPNDELLAFLRQSSILDRDSIDLFVNRPQGVTKWIPDLRCAPSGMT